MFSLQHAGKPAHLPRVVFFITMICAVLFVVTSCSNGTTSDGSLFGTFVAAGGDSYVITPTHLTYHGAGGGDFAGTIEKINFFTGNSGVIIIKYDADAKQEYWDYSDWPNKKGQGGQIDTNPWQPLGDYLGIYFFDLNAASVELANAVDSNDSYYRAEATTLDNAKAKFTMDKSDDFAGFHPAYARQ